MRIGLISDTHGLLRPGGGVRVVVSGHSHRPACSERDGVLYVNPGSAGRRRFSLPIAAAEPRIKGDGVEARLVTLVR